MKRSLKMEQRRMILQTRSMRIEATLIVSKWLAPGRVLRTPPCFLQGGRRFDDQRPLDEAQWTFQNKFAALTRNGASRA